MRVNSRRAGARCIQSARARFASAAAAAPWQQRGDMRLCARCAPSFVVCILYSSRSRIAVVEAGELALMLDGFGSKCLSRARDVRHFNVLYTNKFRTNRDKKEQNLSSPSGQIGN